MMNIKDYYLDINAVHSLEDGASNRIFNMYADLVSGAAAKEGAESYFKSLIKSGFLKNYKEENREEKIDLING